MQDTIAARVNLALALDEQGQDVEAEVQYRATLAMCPLGTVSMGSRGEELAFGLSSNFGFFFNKQRCVVFKGGQMPHGVFVCGDRCYMHANHKEKNLIFPCIYFKYKLQI